MPAPFLSRKNESGRFGLWQLRSILQRRMESSSPVAMLAVLAPHTVLWLVMDLSLEMSVPSFNARSARKIAVRMPQTERSSYWNMMIAPTEELTHVTVVMAQTVMIFIMYLIIVHFGLLCAEDFMDQELE